MKNLTLVKGYKNTTNRHRMEAVRLLSLVKRGLITKQEAITAYADYLECQFGRQVIREFPYKRSA